MFWYYMEGRGVGELNIYIQTAESHESPTKQWTRRGDQGTHWRHGRVTLFSPETNYQVRTKSNHHGNILWQTALCLKNQLKINFSLFLKGNNWGNCWRWTKERYSHWWPHSLERPLSLNRLLIAATIKQAHWGADYCCVCVFMEYLLCLPKVFVTLRWTSVVGWTVPHQSLEWTGTGSLVKVMVLWFHGETTQQILLWVRNCIFHIESSEKNTGWVKKYVLLIKVLVAANLITVFNELRC